MDPASRLALSDSNPYIRRSAVEVLAKGYGVKSIRKRGKEAKARIKRLRSEGARNPAWTDEEKTAVNGLVYVDRLGSEEEEEDDDDDEEEEENDESKDPGIGAATREHTEEDDDNTSFASDATSSDTCEGLANMLRNSYQLVRWHFVPMKGL